MRATNPVFTVLIAALSFFVFTTACNENKNLTSSSAMKADQFSWLDEFSGEFGKALPVSVIIARVEGNKFFGTYKYGSNGGGGISPGEEPIEGKITGGEGSFTLKSGSKMTLVPYKDGVKAIYRRAGAGRGPSVAYLKRRT